MAPTTPSLTKNAILDQPMTMSHIISPSLTLEASNFLANTVPFLTQVPPNITTTIHNHNPLASFIGFHVDVPHSRHVAPLGKLTNIRFMSIFRFKVWWTTHWVGNNGKDIQLETQMIILDKNLHSGRPYVLLLPLIQASFRASLQPGVDDFLDICVESGSLSVCESRFRTCLYMHVGNDPYTLIKDAIKVVRDHLGTFKLLHDKTLPQIVDKFRWCTWDAFYLKVNPQAVYQGVKSLVKDGCPPGFVLIDDGWQSICHDYDQPVNDPESVNMTSAGEQMPCRLIKFEENYKFIEYQGTNFDDKGMGAFIRDLKEDFKSIEHAYVWHALCGYWGGVRPKMTGMPESKVVTPKLSPGLQTTMEDLAVDKLVSNGVGLVPPELAHKLFDGLHSHLQAAGIDGVKIDVIQLLELLSEDFGERVELAKAYYKALTASVRKHFNGNGVIASMEHCNDFMYLGTETISLGRVGDDFWCNDPQGVTNGTYWLQGCHMVHCAYNSLWMGNFIHPDWDMFQTTHPCAAFHAASRAISGGPIYVSDSVGNHNFNLLKGLVLPDGSILRCQYHALPTRDCPFPVKGVNAFAVYMFAEKKLKLLTLLEKMEISLDPFTFELLTVSPVKILPIKFVQFAPIGLVNMFNTGGAIQCMEFDEGVMKIGVKGCGEFKVFASENPVSCKIDGVRVEFGYHDQLVTVNVPWPKSSKLSMVEYLF
ncbi:hypothetical protein ACFE04_018937 [Oxalis oulophora]